MITHKEKVEKITHIVLLAFAITLFYNGRDICHYFYNQYEYPKGSEMRNFVAKQFWDMRFGNYGLILTIVFFVFKNKCKGFIRHLINIGFNLAAISAFDKLVLKDFDFSENDKYIFISVILIELISYYISKNKNGKKSLQRT